jgi:anti-sigma factor RsiW
VSCDPERVTGFADGELQPAESRVVEAHLETCAVCRQQVAAERLLRGRLAALPSPPLPAGLEGLLRNRLRRRPLLTLPRVALPVAAALLAGVVLRGHAHFVAWELVRDHHHCFSRTSLPAQVRSGDPAVVRAWFAARGTSLPSLPARVGDVTLVGARFCSQPDLSSTPHVYYAEGERHVSVFHVPHTVRFADRFATVWRGRSVRLLRVSGATLAVVAEETDDATAFETALTPVVRASLLR